MDSDDEIEECNHCGITIKLKDTKINNWYNGAYFCNSCFELLDDY